MVCHAVNRGGVVVGGGGQFVVAQQTHPQADQVGSCLIFDVKGNAFRLIIGVRYASVTRRGTLFVKHFLTHAEYDRNDLKKDCGHER
jgi:mRNA interferase HigB